MHLESNILITFYTWISTVGQISCQILFLNLSEEVRLRYNFLNNIQKTWADCNFDITNILDNARIGDVPITSQLVTSFNYIINENYVQFWHDEINRKSSLKDYASIKCCPGLENYLLDKNRFPWGKS